MRFTRENCLGDDYGEAFAMSLLEKSGLEIDEADTIVGLFTRTINERVEFFHNETYSDVTWNEEGFDISFENLFNLFSDPLSPTQEECTMFSLEYGVEYIIKPVKDLCESFTYDLEMMNKALDCKEVVELPDNIHAVEEFESWLNIP